MKRQIRRGVFETNSSSTHSVSIYKGRELKYTDIPVDSEIVCDNSYSLGTDIYDEVGKLNFIVTMIASILYTQMYYDELPKDYKEFDKMITHKFFKWLQEVVKEERNTDVVYEKPGDDYFPYYDTTYDEDDSIYSILADNYDLEDQEQFKQRCREIIFDKDVRIKNKEEEY